MPKFQSKTQIEVVQLASFVTKLARKKDLTELKSSKGRPQAIYRVLKKSEIALSEHEVMKASGINTRREYQKALSRLKEILLSHLAKSDLAFAGYSEYAQRLFALDGAIATSRLLGRLGAPYSSADFAETWVREAVELEEWSIARIFLEELINWASLSGDKNEYERLREKDRECKILSEAIESGREAGDRITLVFAKSGAEHPELKPPLLRAIKKLEPVVKKHGTFRLQELLLRLRRKALQLTMDYPEALDICVEMEKLLHTYPLFSNRSRLGRNALAKLTCAVQTRKYAVAEQTLTALEHFPSGSSNWYYFEEWHFILFMHLGKYEEACQLVHSVMESTNYAAQSEPERHKWNIFLVSAELFTGRPVLGEKRASDEKTGEIARAILRGSESFRKDYPGYHAAAIVLEILIILMRRDNLSDIDERVESLRSFRARYLKRKNAGQTGSFFQLLDLLPKHQYIRAPIVAEAAPIFKRMSATTTIDEIQAQQILPYEVMWKKLELMLPESMV